MGRYQACIDLHLILRDEHGRVLLGERQNTGWADGQLGLPSGHLEDGESARTGAAREAEEEIGVLIKADELPLVHLMHHYTNSGRVALFFEARSWSGEITNTEPDKCVGWNFHDLTDLPANMVPYVAEALRHVASGQRYSERGW
ncbi:NUDIX domain-containing protein [Solwaraspora sp. WMMD406]|uniref:NUDIX hydrolase n=1 Tax=Solwaraspora sp. WMMD406 TaxID=3016095 RepID=UPI002417B3CD|nr:NUDIX domain-containing protein [Solwaraspora sp. WMMD406]MDG4768307.1 NUDIX domain-containing protein [Solwaraspora sp. WMMD406]